MKITLHKFDPVKRTPTGDTEEVSVPDNKFTYDLVALWKVLGRSGKPDATTWAPPSDDSIFDGHGWVEKENIDESMVASLFEQGIVDHRFVEAQGMTQKVFDIFVKAADSQMSKTSNRNTEYTELERETWELQLTEARGFLNDNQEAPLLQSIADVEKKSVKDVAESVISHHEKRSRTMVKFTILANKIRSEVKTIKLDSSNAKESLKAALDVLLSARTIQ